jgi:dTDP-4-amino-4,6-dideoxygalactose transaminase
MTGSILGVSRDTPVRDAMARIDARRGLPCLVTDSDGRLLRTVTDGDIRRGLLAGLTLDHPVADLPGRDPVTVPPDAAPAGMLALMAATGVTVLVVADAAGRPQRLVRRQELAPDLLLSPPHMGPAEQAFVAEAFADNWIAPAGPHLAAFEAALAPVTGRRHVVALSSGTAALHLAVRVLDIGPGDQVLVSDTTFAASLNPILYQGAEPVLIDSEPGSWNMSPGALGRALTAAAARGRPPKAIIVVHLYGQPADMEAIMALADAHGVPVIEDAAESLGATCGNRPSGAHGLLSAFSFNGNKIITTSGGGALASDDPALIARARSLSTQGRDPAEHYQHSEIAFNYRMSNILAGIGRGQLALLPDRVAARRAIFARYREALGTIPGIGFQDEAPGTTGNRWLTVARFDPDHIPVHPYRIMAGLRAQGIDSRPGWKPMHMQPLARAFRFWPHDHDHPVSPGLFLTSLALPSGSAMTPADQDRVIAAVRDLVAA